MNYLLLFIFSEFFLLLLIPFANGFDHEEDVWARDDAILDRRIQEQEERFELGDLLKAEKDIVYKWLYDTKTRLITREATRLKFEEEKKKYQSEMAPTGGDDNASASAGASKLPSTNVNEKTSNVEVISSSEETDTNARTFVPAEPILNDSIDARPSNWLPSAGDKKGKKRKHSSESSEYDPAGDEKRAKNTIYGIHHDDHQRAALWKHLVRFEDVLLTKQADVDRQKEEQNERSKLKNLKGLTPRQISDWIYNKKNLLMSKNSAIVREQFEREKKKYQSEMAATAGGDKDKASASASAPAKVPPAAANRAKNAILVTRHDDDQRAALWRHFVRFEDVLVTEQADVDRQEEENEERSKLRNSIGLTQIQIKNWLYNIKSKLRKNSAIIREQFEREKRKYQSEMSATGEGDKDKASAGGATAPKVPPAAANEANNAIPRHDDHQRAALWRHFVRFEDVLVNENANVDRQKEEKEERSKLRNSFGLTPKQTKQWIYNIKIKLRENSAIVRKKFESEKKKYQSEMAANISGGKDKASASASAPAEVPPAVADLNLNLEQSNAEEEDKMQEDG